MEHNVALPLAAEEWEDGAVSINADNGAGDVVAWAEDDFSQEQKLAKAQFIVRACNAHEELMRALRDLREAATDAYKMGRIPAEPFVRAGNVLANVSGK
jgi:hypothetical protein